MARISKQKLRSWNLSARDRMTCWGKTGAFWDSVVQYAMAFKTDKFVLRMHSATTLSAGVK
jgi:hypothetical protein